MAHRDCRAIPVSTASNAAVQRLDEIANEVLLMVGDPLEKCGELIAEEPDISFAHCLSACLRLGTAKQSERALAAADLGRASALPMNNRERNYFEAASAWQAGELEQCVRAWERQCTSQPLDLLAVRMLHDLYFWLGDAEKLRDGTAQVLPAYDADVPGYGLLRGMHAFGLEESGDYTRAEEEANIALSHEPRDVWAVHAMAHVLEMRNDAGGGIRFLRERHDDWSHDNFLAGHNWWHLSLFLIEQERFDRVLDMYDRSIRRDGSCLFIELNDAAAVLWRLQLMNVDVGERWVTLAEDWASVVDNAVWPFYISHGVIALAGAGRLDECDALIARMERAAKHDETYSSMMHTAGLPLSRAIRAFAAENYSACIEGLLACRYHLRAFGGSHAQRDIAHLTLLEAARRAGEKELTRALLSERLGKKPNSPRTHRLMGECLSGFGEETQAARYQQQAESLAAQ